MEIMLLVNKKFEYYAYKEGLDFRRFDKKTSQLVLISEDKSEGPRKMVPSREYKLAPYHRIKEFCIEYMFDNFENTSNSEKKHIFLNEVIAKYRPDYIISVSTSESTPESQNNYSKNNSVNGSVFFGNRFFARNCRDCDEKSESRLDVPTQFDISEEIYPGFYKDLSDDDNKAIIAEGMEKVPNAPTDTLSVNANEKNISLGVINVEHHDEYAKADKKTYDDFVEANPYKDDVPVCIETTHAVVKMAAEDRFNIPVLFVSPITDRYLKFKEDVNDEQNKVCSYNAGVVMANLLDFISSKL